MEWKVEVSDSSPQNIVVSDSNDSSIAFSYPVSFVRGVAYPVSCGPDRWEDLNSKIRYRSSDILVVSYPKCGTTWIEQTVLLLLSGGHAEALDPLNKNVYTEGSTSLGLCIQIILIKMEKIIFSTFEIFLFSGKIWPEACVDQVGGLRSRGHEFATLSWDAFNNAPSPRVIKSHSPLPLLLGSHGQGMRSLPRGTKAIIISRNPLDACVSSYYHAFNPCKSGWPFEGYFFIFKIFLHFQTIFVTVHSLGSILDQWLLCSR